MPPPLPKHLRLMVLGGCVSTVVDSAAGSRRGRRNVQSLIATDSRLANDALSGRPHLLTRLSELASIALGDVVEDLEGVSRPETRRIAQDILRKESCAIMFSG